jgi:hypothetical protein
MPYSDELKKQIESIELEISNSKVKNLETENKLMRLKLAEFEEDIREESENKATLLKG